MTTKRRYILANFPGGGPPDPPPPYQEVYPKISTAHHFMARGQLSCRRQHAPPTLLRYPPTLKVADNPGPVSIKLV